MDADVLRLIESKARVIGHIIGDQMPKGFGFALCLFSFHGPEFTYISNAQRADMVRALDELVAKLKRGEAGMTSERKN